MKIILGYALAGLVLVNEFQIRTINAIRQKGTQVPGPLHSTTLGAGARMRSFVASEWLERNNPAALAQAWMLVNTLVIHD